MRKATKRQQDFWEDVLSQHNLGLDRGRAGKSQEDGKRRLTHIGDEKDLELEVKRIINKKIGRVTPKGKGPE